jgi:hypothetical protein
MPFNGIEAKCLDRPAGSFVGLGLKVRWPILIGLRPQPAHGRLDGFPAPSPSGAGSAALS